MNEWQKFGRKLEWNNLIPKTCISINSFSFKIDNKYQRGKIFLIIYNLLLSILFFNFSTISFFQYFLSRNDVLVMKSIFRAMNIFLPHIPGFIYFPAQQESRSQIPFRSIVTVNVHIIRCVALHKDSVATFSTSSRFSFYEHGDISPKIDRIARSKLYTAGILVKHTRQSADSIQYRTNFTSNLLESRNKMDESSSPIRGTTLSYLYFMKYVLHSYSFKHCTNFHLRFFVSKHYSRIS